MMRRVVAVVVIGLAGASILLPAADPTAVGPRSPAEERTTFQLPPGFRADLVAAEPDVVDPVAMCFDEKGRLFVAEMRGYPNGGVGTGNETRGRIKCLTDTDGDGKFETSTVFAEGLRFPMGLQPWRGGLIVAAAPDILYLQDTDGDGKADKTTTLYTEFNTANIQQMVNSLQFALDNLVYGCAGVDGGLVKSAQDSAAPAVSLRNRGIRFDPDVPASLEPTSSGGQYGLTADDAGHWFTATNSQHLRQIVLPDHYLRRNPYLGVSSVTLDIPEHGPSARIYRVSPFEAWRVERTTRRARDTTGRKYPSNELVPGGYFTSACSPLIYTADLFPEQYRGNNFVCDPANNLVHREVLAPRGSVFTARRVDAEKEFLASTDNWFRPVNISIGPNGALYVLDFYREVIETPLSLPEDIKKKLNLESRGRGRIWRVAPDGFSPSRMPDFSRFTTTQLVDALLKSNPWWRLTAQRLLFERKPVDATAIIRTKLATAVGKPGLSNLLWTLQGSGALTPEDLASVYADPLPGNRKNAARLSEWFFTSSPDLREQAAKLVADPSPQVRFQLALSAGAMPPEQAAAVLIRLLVTDGADPWLQTAALSSSGLCALEIIHAISHGTEMPAATRDAVLRRVAAIIGAKGDNAAIARVLRLIGESSSLAPGLESALLDGLGQGMRNSKTPLPAWLAKPPIEMPGLVEKLKGRFEQAAKAVQEDSATNSARVAAARLLAFAPFDVSGPALAAALSPSSSGDLQSAAVRGLSGFAEPRVGELLLRGWSGYGPALRREVLEALLARPDRALVLLAAVEKKVIAANELEPVRVRQLKAHPNQQIRDKAVAVLTADMNLDRAKVVADYRAVAKLMGDVGKGRGLFKTHCSACHKLADDGNDVGPNLLAVLPGKSAEDLLAALFDPNREVDPRYVSYQAVTADGRQVTGIVSVETPTSVTLRRADGAEDTILRANLESLRSTKLSLMPEGFEKQLAKQDVADLFAFLRAAVGGK